MKNLCFLFFIAISLQSIAQQNYCDFEGLQAINFGPRTGTLDTTFINPAPDGVNASANCAQYMRSAITYDNFKLYPYTKMADITLYASNAIGTPKFSMKVYSTAPVGTFIDLQLGSKGNDNYPAGIHSEYRGVTTVQNAWEEIIFDYVQSPAGGLVASTDIDKMVILFYPSSTSTHTFYFDDIMGPTLIPIGVRENEMSAGFKLYQNSPNPSRELTYISFQLNTPGSVSLELMDMLGNPVISILDKNMKAGNYSIPVETENIVSGIYFYVLNKDGGSMTKRMIVIK